MGRPSAQLDQKLLKMGRKHFLKHGVSGLSIRKVAQDANVNLGMFNYHFKTKKQFVSMILQEEYEKFFASLQSEFSSKNHEGHARQKLQALLLTMVHLAISNRAFLLMILKDVLSGNDIALAFAKKNMPRHLGLILESIREGQRVGELQKNLSADQVLIMCMSVAGPPIMIGEAILSGSMMGIKNKKQLSEKFLSFENIEKRIACLMKGLKP